jgi:hypothetical protein
MQNWIIEADIYRLKKAMTDASASENAKIAQHLRRAEAQLLARKQRGLSG